jgi:preprotein translocase subunit YajC
MLWWFLILGVSTAVVVSVALALYMRVRRQMKRTAAHRAELDSLDHLDHSSPEA